MQRLSSFLSERTPFILELFTSILLVSSLALAQEAQTGHIIVDLRTYPAGDAYAFDFYINGSTSSHFTMTHYSPPNNQELAPGIYTIYGPVPEDWNIDERGCVSSIGDQEYISNIELDAGETVTCYFSYMQEQHPLSVGLDLGTRWLQFYEWTINKDVSPASADASMGETVYFDYEIGVNQALASEDYRIEGTVYVTNSIATARSFAVYVEVGGVYPPVTCFDQFGAESFVVLGNSTSECFFDLRNLNGPEYAGYELSVRVETTDAPPFVTTYVSAFVEWSGEPIRVDSSFETVTVVDDAQEPFFDSRWPGASNGVAFLNQQSYTCPGDASLYQNGQYSTSISNTASIEETGTSDTATVTINCFSSVVEQCTYGHGYWRNHGTSGSAHYDDAWLNLGAAGQNTIFFLSGQTYYDVLGTPPRGNPYYQLARQYIAAKLNILNGVTAPQDVVFAIAAAEEFFFTYAPTTELPSHIPDLMRGFATTLEAFNSGSTGPGSCGE